MAILRHFDLAVLLLKIFDGFAYQIDHFSVGRSTTHGTTVLVQVLLSCLSSVELSFRKVFLRPFIRPFGMKLCRFIWKYMKLVFEKVQHSCAFAGFCGDTWRYRNWPIHFNNLVLKCTIISAKLPALKLKSEML